MRLLTINTHSLIEDDYETKLDIFENAAYRIRPDIIAMQEVNQTKSSPVAALGEDFDMRCDNHALRFCENLAQKGLKYNFVWRGIKEAYGKYEEGVALLSRFPIRDTDTFIISDTDDKKNWKTRRTLGIKVGDEWFYSVHTGKYGDESDSFETQISRLNSRLYKKGKVWLLGDFNCDADSAGYEKIVKSGWYDTFSLASEKDSGVTVRGQIDGWRDGEVSDLRIDYIFCNRKVSVKSSKVIFNGCCEKIVSDHFGLLTEVE